jgi:hypothetical protein
MIIIFFKLKSMSFLINNYRNSKINENNKSLDELRKQRRQNIINSINRIENTNDINISFYIYFKDNIADVMDGGYLCNDEYIINSNVDDFIFSISIILNMYKNRNKHVDDEDDDDDDLNFNNIEFYKNKNIKIELNDKIKTTLVNYPSNNDLLNFEQFIIYALNYKIDELSQYDNLIKYTVFEICYELIKLDVLSEKIDSTYERIYDLIK